MDLTVRLDAETGVSFRNVHALNCAVITTYDITLTCQSNRTIRQLSLNKYSLMHMTTIDNKGTGLISHNKRELAVETCSQCQNRE